MTALDAPVAISGTPSSTTLSRDQILDVTSRCLREFGYDATTIRKIASMLDCAVGSIYRYFADKRELLSAVTQQILEPVAALAGAGSVEQSVRLYHQLATHAPEMYRLMFWLACPETSSGGELSGINRLPGVVHQIVEGWTRHTGDAAAARRAWSLVHGYILLGVDGDETAEAVLAALPQMLRPAGIRQELPRIVITARDIPKPAAVRPESPAPQVAPAPDPEPRTVLELVAEDAQSDADDVCLL